MHHKFRENSKEPLKDASTGNSYSILSAHPSLDSQEVYPTACAGSRYNTGFRKQVNLFQESSFAGPKQYTEEDFKDERNSDFFDGFLAIGTLGGETLLDEQPATPTFGMSFEDPAIDDADVTENDLKLISNELDKFLEAEAKEGHHQPSGRNSDTNTIASTIEAIEGIAGKKDRASLGELFQITEVQDKQSENIYGKKKKQPNSAHKSAKHLVKKVLKKIHPSSRGSVSGKPEVDSTKKKFQKMVQVFHRKVHPEESIMETKIYSSVANPKSSKANSIDLTFEKVNHCHEASKRCIQYELRSSRSAKNGEHWIKTDEDYFVLEL
ncbi:hypothetical protein ISN45_At05g012880 [Arabidopsis thaliana x Arabidopsis arenosa]|uniref:LAZY1 n=1 Tax=Arabidopsis thaliana x Arabidopsis arenosa TaxID=1240361 RepID=A0A8T2CRS8_9BRAS|nr:hypothetical protein ISN45_At05g012880 [Arabidopsis thaliana x Arabidopsis arenosa]